MKHTYLLTLLLFATASFAQDSVPTKPKKNIVEIQPLALIIRTFGLGYQRAISNKLTLEARLFGTDRTMIPTGTDYVFHTELQANYFPLKRHIAPKGFYVGSCVSAATSIYTHPVLKGVYLGGMTGYQWVFKCRVTTTLGLGVMTPVYGTSVHFSDPNFIPICKLAMGYNF